MSKLRLQIEATWKFLVLENHVEVFSILLLGRVLAKPGGSRVRFLSKETRSLLWSSYLAHDKKDYNFSILRVCLYVQNTSTC